jgi:hypothetical protein
MVSSLRWTSSFRFEGRLFFLATKHVYVRLLYNSNMLQWFIHDRKEEISATCEVEISWQ